MDTFEQRQILNRSIRKLETKLARQLAAVEETKQEIDVFQRELYAIEKAPSTKKGA